MWWYKNIMVPKNKLFTYNEQYKVIKEDILAILLTSDAIK